MKNELLIAAATLGFLTNVAIADPNAYVFRAAAPSIKVGKTSEMDVRLTEKATGKPVTNASITAMRLDMGPDNMADMAAQVKQISSTQPDVYRFIGNVMAPGQWALRLTASVAGEKEPINGVVVFKAVQ